MEQEQLNEPDQKKKSKNNNKVASNALFFD